MPFCENCGNKLAETAKFCSNCGLAIKASEGQELVQKDETQVESLSTILDLLKQSDSYKFYDFERYFGAIATQSNLLYLLDNIPNEKLNAIIRRELHNFGYIEDFQHHLYYNESMFGSRDTGYLISSNKNTNKLCLLALTNTGVYVLEFNLISSIIWKGKDVINIFYSGHESGKLQIFVLTILFREFGNRIIEFHKAYFNRNLGEIIAMVRDKNSANSPIRPKEINISPIKPKDGAGIR